jgi:hypothetical protein
VFIRGLLVGFSILFGQFAGAKPWADQKTGLKIRETGRRSGKRPTLAAGRKPDGKCLWPKINFKTRSGRCLIAVGAVYDSALLRNSSRRYSDVWMQ